MAHKVKKQDLDDYVKCLAVKRGCPVSSVNRTKAHWDLIMNHKACMEAIQSYKGTRSIAVHSVGSGLRTDVTGTGTGGK